MNKEKQQAEIPVYSLSNYKYGTQDVYHLSEELHDENIDLTRAQLKEDEVSEFNPKCVMDVLKRTCRESGRRDTVQAILLTHIHGHPHILLMENVVTGVFSLPGGQVSMGKSSADGLRSCLDEALRPFHDTCQPFPIMEEYAEPTWPEWNVGPLVAQWWRPHFENNLYPYVPAHVKNPAECIKIYLVTLPQSCALGTGRYYKLTAVAFYDIFANEQRFGPIIASIPQILSRYNLSFK